MRHRDRTPRVRFPDRRGVDSLKIHEDIASFAEQVARKAGGILLGGFRSDETVVTYKGRTNIVTNIDNASEEFIVNSIVERFPDHGIVAEEGSEKNSHGDYLWYIDPLDGTNNYAHGIAQFSISLGVLSKKDGDIVAGIVFDPVHDEMFTAVKDGGAFLNGKRIAVSLTDDIGYSILASGFPYDKDVNDDNNVREFSLMVPRIQGVRRLGSAALDLAFVACGRLDGYWEKGIQPWDIAAGSLIVIEAGGKVSDYTGSRLDYTGRKIIASNGRIHFSIIKILSGR